MLTEFEVRRRMESIQTSRLAPLRKARLLLRLGKSLNPQVKSLTTAQQQAATTTNSPAKASLKRLARNTARLHADVRDAAWYALSANETPSFRS